MNRIEKNRAAQRGFSLLELSISMMIVGILIAAGVQSYNLWAKDKRAELTKAHSETMAIAVQGFFATHGRYPCPAPLSVARTDPSYGRQTDCTVMAPPVGQCANGICISQSIRSVTANYDGNDTTPETTMQPRIRIGAIPFRDLGIDEILTLDGDNNRFTYAVTEFEASYNGIVTSKNKGGIEIRDASNNSILKTAGSADYIIVSHGDDGIGAYNMHGGLITQCPPSATSNDLDQENCNNFTPYLTNNAAQAIFRSAQTSTATGTAHFDDVVLHETPGTAPRWTYSPTGTGNIYHMYTDGALGGDYAYNWYMSQPLGSAAYNAFMSKVGPAVKLWITGDMKIEGKIKSDKFCDKDKDDCFNPDMIGGTGIHCASGAMGGINNPTPNNPQAICNTGWTIECTPPQVIVGIQNGLPVCGNIPCKAQTDSVCTTSVSLPASPHGTVITETGGDYNCSTATFSCSNGKWTKSETGFCVCPAAETQTYSCPVCGTGGGVKTMEKIPNCAACDPGSWVVTEACPAVDPCPEVDTSTTTSTSTSTSTGGSTTTSTTTSTSTSSNGDASNGSGSGNGDASNGSGSGNGDASNGSGSGSGNGNGSGNGDASNGNGSGSGSGSGSGGGSGGGSDTIPDGDSSSFGDGDKGKSK